MSELECADLQEADACYSNAIAAASKCLDIEQQVLLQGDRLSIRSAAETALGRPDADCIAAFQGLIAKLEPTPIGAMLISRCSRLFQQLGETR